MRAKSTLGCVAVAGAMLGAALAIGGTEAAPRARRSLGQVRPVARTFARRIARARTDRATEAR